MRGVHIATVVAFVLIAASQASLKAQTPAPAAIDTLAVPGEIGAFSLAETHRYPDPRLGTLYRYRNNSELRPDVYVYPPGGPTGSQALNPAREEGMNFGHVLTAQRSRRQINSFEIMKSAARDHIVGSDTVPGWHVYAVLETNRGRSDSHLYLFAFGDQMLKVRSTSPEGSVDSAELEAFVMALLRAVSAENDANLRRPAPSSPDCDPV